MTDLVALLLIFIAVGAGFLSTNMLVGKFIRPDRPSEEKQTIYECGEPTIGSSWIQFDVRFYVVALLFVIFDVEMAFFFPWATVFGNANKLAQDELPMAQRVEAQHNLLPNSEPVTQNGVSEQRTAPDNSPGWPSATSCFSSACCSSASPICGSAATSTGYEARRHKRRDRPRPSRRFKWDCSREAWKKVS